MSGDTIVAGAPRATVSGHQAQGAAYVFVKPAGGWADGQESLKLTAADGAGSDQFGTSVAIDGNTVVVGAQWKFLNGLFGQGAAYVFVNGVQQARLLASDGTSDDNFGSSVGVSGDTVGVGAGSARDFRGAVYVFVKPAGGWTDATQTAKLLASDGGLSDHLGFSLAVSGNTVAAGATSATVAGNRPGAVYVFVKPAGGWSDGTQTAKLVASDGANGDDLGWSLGIGTGHDRGRRAWLGGQLCGRRLPVQRASGRLGGRNRERQVDRIRRSGKRRVRRIGGGDERCGDRRGRLTGQRGWRRRVRVHVGRRRRSASQLYVGVVLAGIGDGGAGDELYSDRDRLRERRARHANRHRELQL